MKVKGAIEDCAAPGDTLEALHTLMSLTDNDCSIPISLVAHEVGAPQRALPSEEKKKNQCIKFHMLTVHNC